jgi:hypothetical protein
MAARNKAWTPEKVRQRIRASMLVRRLKNHVLGKVDMSPTQLKAAEILLKKALPDLSAVEHSGSIDQPMTRDAIIERLTAIHAAAVASADDRGTARSSESDDGPATTH